MGSNVKKDEMFKHGCSTNADGVLGVRGDLCVLNVPLSPMRNARSQINNNPKRVH